MSETRPFSIERLSSEGQVLTTLLLLRSSSLHLHLQSPPPNTHTHVFEHLINSSLKSRIQTEAVKAQVWTPRVDVGGIFLPGSDAFPASRCDPGQGRHGQVATARQNEWAAEVAASRAGEISWEIDNDKSSTLRLPGRLRSAEEESRCPIP